MIKIEHTQVVGWEPAIRGMRNPMNSWEKSDTVFDGEVPKIGKADLDLMKRLSKAGPVEGKYKRMIVVYADILAPLYWWKEFDTYKVGTVSNSCSTMHKIHEKVLTLDDFSCEHLEEGDGGSLSVLKTTITELNNWRLAYEVSKDKGDWWQMIQLLPSSYNQKRTVMLNYEVLTNIYHNRRNHKLDEWRELCKWITELPYSELITGENTVTMFSTHQLYGMFIKQNPKVSVMDYRPYPGKLNSIIIWADQYDGVNLAKITEFAYTYNSESGMLEIIKDARRYQDLI